jgi:hypothetical protein
MLGLPSFQNLSVAQLRQIVATTQQLRASLSVESLSFNGLCSNEWSVSWVLSFWWLKCCGTFICIDRNAIFVIIPMIIRGIGIVCIALDLVRYLFQGVDMTAVQCFFFVLLHPIVGFCVDSAEGQDGSSHIITLFPHRGALASLFSRVPMFVRSRHC